MPPTWVPPGHFYSPLVDPALLQARAAAVFAPDQPLPAIDLNATLQLRLFHKLAEYYPLLPFTAEPSPGLRYHYDNDAFSYADAIMLATMLLHVRPRRVIEVGSGWSSCVILDINERFFANRIDCTFIEPYPELLLRLMHPGDRDRVRVIGTGVQDVDSAVFASLQAGDVLFIDSTHVAKCDSDVTHHFFRTLPALPSGVFIHVHDVFNNFEYPPDWFFAENRSWNELYLLRAFLMHNRQYEIVFFNDFFFRTQRDLVARLMPDFLRNSGGSFWMRKL